MKTKGNHQNKSGSEVVVSGSKKAVAIDTLVEILDYEEAAYIPPEYVISPKMSHHPTPPPLILTSYHPDDDGVYEILPTAVKTPSSEEVPENKESTLSTTFPSKQQEESGVKSPKTKKNKAYAFIGTSSSPGNKNKLTAAKFIGDLVGAFRQSGSEDDTNSSGESNAGVLNNIQQKQKQLVSSPTSSTTDRNKSLTSLCVSLDEDGSMWLDCSCQVVPFSSKNNQQGEKSWQLLVVFNEQSKSPTRSLDLTDYRFYPNFYCSDNVDAAKSSQRQFHFSLKAKSDGKLAHFKASDLMTYTFWVGVFNKIVPPSDDTPSASQPVDESVYLPPPSSSCRVPSASVKISNNQSSSFPASPTSPSSPSKSPPCLNTPSPPLPMSPRKGSFPEQLSSSSPQASTTKFGFEEAYYVMPPRPACETDQSAAVSPTGKRQQQQSRSQNDLPASSLPAPSSPLKTCHSFEVDKNPRFSIDDNYISASEVIQQPRQQSKSSKLEVKLERKDQKAPSDAKPATPSYIVASKIVKSPENNNKANSPANNNLPAQRSEGPAAKSQISTSAIHLKPTPLPRITHQTEANGSPVANNNSDKSDGPNNIRPKKASCLAEVKLRHVDAISRIDQSVMEHQVGTPAVKPTPPVVALKPTKVNNIRLNNNPNRKMLDETPDKSQQEIERILHARRERIDRATAAAIL